MSRVTERLKPANDSLDCMMYNADVLEYYDYILDLQLAQPTAPAPAPRPQPRFGPSAPRSPSQGGNATIGAFYSLPQPDSRNPALPDPKARRKRDHCCVLLLDSGTGCDKIAKSSCKHDKSTLRTLTLPLTATTSQSEAQRERSCDI